MPTSSSTKKNPRERPRCRFLLDWPVERVVVGIQVEAPRDITVLEWALLRVLEEFPDHTPTLREAADQLGIKAPVFLEETLQALIQIEAVELNVSDETPDLANCQLNDHGRQLLRVGRTGGLAERHGLHLHLDAITGEHLPKVRNLREQPARPVLDPKELPARTMEIGLDRVRKLSQLQGEPFHRGESRIRKAAVRAEDGRLAWLPIELELRIDETGLLAANLQNATKTQQRWFARRDLAMLGNLGRAATGSWANGRCQTRPPVMAAEEWFEVAERLANPSATADEARELVQDAEEELVLHPGWLDAPRMDEALTDAAERGVRCTVCGAKTSLEHWSARESRAPGFVVSGGRPDNKRPLAIVADGTRALRVDVVCARTPGGRGLDVEITAFVPRSVAVDLRQQLVRGLVETLDETDERQAFAAFAITGNVERWERCAQRIWKQTDGVDRVVKLRDWASWGQHVVGEENSDSWRAWPLRAWRAAFEAAADGLNGQLDPLLDAAVDLVPPREVLARLIQGIEPVSVLEDPVALCQLLQSAAPICRRWSTFDPVRACQPFVHAVRSTLDGTDSERQGAATQAAMELVADTPNLRAVQDLCARLLSASLGKPHDLAGLVGWLEAHVPLKRFLGPGFPQRARQHLKRTPVDLSKGRARAAQTARALVQAWTELELPEADLADFKDAYPSPKPAGRRARQRH